MADRHVIIGDVHGCISELKALLKKVEFDPGKDIGISLGDLTDRGPDSAACILLMKDMGFKLCHSNHDARFINWKAKENALARGHVDHNDVLLKDVHVTTLKGIQGHPRESEIWEYLQNYHLIYEFSSSDTVYHCIHGGYIPANGPSTSKRWIIRLRKLENKTNQPIKHDSSKDATIWPKLWQGPQRVIFGHMIFNKPAFFEHAIGIDTGCVFGGRLSALVVNKNGSEKIVSVAAQKSYCE